MQELTFEQVEVVSGGDCGAADLAKDAYVGAGAAAGAIVLGATTIGFGAAIGGFIGGMIGSLAWQGSKDDVVAVVCDDE